MKIFLSHVLNKNTPAYGGGEGIDILPIKRIGAGDSCNTQCWILSNHIGTHLDAPRHFLEEGATVDHYPADYWFCRNVALVAVPLDEPRWIIPNDLGEIVDRDIDCLLIKTGFQRFRGTEKYWKDNPGLSLGLAEWLRLQFPSLRYVGMDFISVSRIMDREEGRRSHAALLQVSPPGSAILPIEDMNLAGLGKGCRINSAIVIPLRVAGSDGSPVTVIADVHHDPH